MTPVIILNLPASAHQITFFYLQATDGMSITYGGSLERMGLIADGYPIMTPHLEIGLQLDSLALEALAIVSCKNNDYFLIYYLF